MIFLNPGTVNSVSGFLLKFMLLTVSGKADAVPEFSRY